MKQFYTKLKPTAAILLFTLGVFGIQQVAAQLNPFSSIYYQNQYLSNPAMAGMENHVHLNLSLRKQYSGMPGAPKNQSFSADGGFGKHVGLGLNINNDKAGLLQYTRVMGTYAYHLPVGKKNEKLSFGISMGFMNERVNEADVNGENGDESVGRLNQRETFLDGDFGLAFTSDKFTIQGTLPNLKSVFRPDDVRSVNYSLFFTALSYKLLLNQSWISDVVIEPKIAYRGIKGFDNIVDLGANISMPGNGLSLMSIWHSSQSATFGIGLNLNKTFHVLGIYTAETGKLRGYSNGDFEIALKARLF